MSSSKDDLVDTRVRSGQSEAPTPSPILGIYVLPTVPIDGIVFKDTHTHTHTPPKLLD